MLLMTFASGRASAQTTPLAPKTKEPPPDAVSRKFVADPVVDGAVIALSGGFSLIGEQLMSTGEIRPQQPVANSQLLGIDRVAITQTVDPNAGTRSTIGLSIAMAYAVIDPIASGFRYGGTALITDAVIYAETLTINLALTDLAKIAFRRPRPSAYARQKELIAQYGDKAPDVTGTDSALSFYSGHTSSTAAIGAAATYLAFARDPGGIRPWITLGASVALTGFVGYERVRSGAHFPTDVIAGALAGAGVGVLVPHLHREDSAKQRPTWIGMLTVAPIQGGGALLEAQGAL